MNVRHWDDDDDDGGGGGVNKDEEDVEQAANMMTSECVSAKLAETQTKPSIY